MCFLYSLSASIKRRVPDMLEESSMDNSVTCGEWAQRLHNLKFIGQNSIILQNDMYKHWDIWEIIFFKSRSTNLRLSRKEKFILLALKGSKFGSLSCLLTGQLSPRSKLWPLDTLTRHVLTFLYQGSLKQKLFCYYMQWSSHCYLQIPLKLL